MDSLGASPLSLCTQNLSAESPLATTPDTSFNWVAPIAPDTQGSAGAPQRSMGATLTAVTVSATVAALLVATPSEAL